MWALESQERLVILGGAVAVITAVVSGVGWALKLLITRIVPVAAETVMAKNTEEHVVNYEVLKSIEQKLDNHSDLLLAHLTWHVSHPIKSKEAA